MKSIISCVFFIFLLIPSCTNSATNYPQIECTMKLLPEHATFCSKTVAMNIGPADQFIGYSIVQGQAVSILKKDLAESMFSVGIDHKKTFIKNIDEIASNENVIFYKSGSRGENSLSIDPGNYVICTQSKQYPSTNQPILSCEPAVLKMDHKYQLLIIDNPRAGMQFEWKE
jgi:hypothetical protein